MKITQKRIKEIIQEEIQKLNETSDDYQRAVVLWQLHYETKADPKQIANKVWDSHKAKNALKSMGYIPKADIPAYYRKDISKYNKSDKMGVLKHYRDAERKL